MPNWRLVHESFGFLYSERSFSANYGLSEDSCQVAWVDLDKYCPSKYKPKHFLWTLDFLKDYGTIDSLSTKFGVTEKTYRTKVWKLLEDLFQSLHYVRFCFMFFIFFSVFLFFSYVQFLSFLVSFLFLFLFFFFFFSFLLNPNSSQVDIQSRFDQEISPNIYMYIDSTSCPIRRPSNSEAQAACYNGKNHTHSVKYECAVRVDGLFVWRTHAFPGSVHDIKIFQDGGLSDELLASERLIGDKGYIGSDLIITPYRGRNLTEEQKDFNTSINKSRVLIERSFGRLKSFGILSKPFRNHLDKHEIVFDICLNLTNINIIFQPLFQ